MEVQTLVAASTLSQPRRSAQGLDSGRLALLLAVLERRADLPIQALDIYAMAVGGVCVVEPGVDLAICVALASSFVGRPVPETTVACGEVGLGGELRQVGRLDFRLAEASRMGFTTAVVAPNCGIVRGSSALVALAETDPNELHGPEDVVHRRDEVDAPIELLRVPTLAAALDLLDLRRS